MERFLTISQRKRPRSPTEPVQPDNPAIHKDPDVHYNENREDWDHEEQVPPPTDPLHPQQQDQLAATTNCSGTSGTSAAPLHTVIDISQSACDGPRRPMLRKYPTKKYGLQMRSFNRRWYEQYTWLEYSVTMETTYCIKV
ncbi:hypothetical protein F7725_005287 [Dissostichus mawsoni]|uniref:Uncharacterized protein n=1 Tax=Dissostichus mawsoni TaxID=36200 RepID=A0A7J5YQT8_DISMA|nr:hypothetical protein F7725_005287 [Dissostichus mawsoni]